MCDRHESNNFMFVLKRGSMLLDWNPPAAKDNFFHKYSNVELFASLVSSEEGPNLRMEKPNSSDRSWYNSSVDIKVIQWFKDVSTGRSTHGMQAHKFDQVIQPGSTLGEKMQLSCRQESDFNRSVQRVLASMYHLRLEEALWSEIWWNTTLQGLLESWTDYIHPDFRIVLFPWFAKNLELDFAVVFWQDSPMFLLSWLETTNLWYVCLPSGENIFQISLDPVFLWSPGRSASND